MKKNIGSFDTDTGEILEGICVWVGKKIKSPFEGGFYMANHEAGSLLARNREISGEALRVFLEIVGKLDFQNYIHVQQKEVAKNLHMTEGNVSRAIKSLCEKKVFVRGPKVLRASTFRLNPNYGWKGKIKNLKLAIDNSKGEFDYNS